MLDREFVMIEHLRKLGAQEGTYFSRGHLRCCHYRRTLLEHDPNLAVKNRASRTALSYLCKIAVPAEATAEAGRACNAVFDQGLAAVVPFLNQSLAYAKPMALDGRPAVGANANLRKARDLLCHCLRLRACSSLRGEVFAQADRQALLGRHLASGKNNFERAALPHNARQSHRTSID